MFGTDKSGSCFPSSTLLQLESREILICEYILLAIIKYTTSDVL